MVKIKNIFLKIFKSKIFLISWRIFLFFICIPLVLMYLTVLFLQPNPATISYDISCEKDNNCQKIIHEERPAKIEEEIRNISDNADRIVDFSKPSLNIIRFDFRITNKSLAVLEITDPKRRIEKEARIFCVLNNKKNIFSFNSGNFFEQKSKLSEIPNNIKVIQNLLNSCMPENQIFDFQNGKGPVVYPNAYVLLKIEEKYNLEFIPDRLSYFLLYLVWLIIMFAFIPLLKEVKFFIQKGRKYFKC